MPQGGQKKEKKKKKESNCNGSGCCRGIESIPGLGQWVKGFGVAAAVA